MNQTDLKALLAQTFLDAIHQFVTLHEVSFPDPTPVVSLQIPPPGMPGHFTLVLFPWLKPLQTQPLVLGAFLQEAFAKRPEVKEAVLVKGFLNLTMAPEVWHATLAGVIQVPQAAPKNSGVLIEYPSPNTNKPLHLGHLRNIFLGTSLGKILAAEGYEVHRVNLYNDRGTNISKSMLAYLNAQEKRTPGPDIKGDKLVGDYYVAYNQSLQEEIAPLVAQGVDKETARAQSQHEAKVAELTVAWEEGNEEVRALWKKMNGWFYEGVEQTYQALGLSFDKVYYESDVYHLGRETVAKGITSGVFYQKEDGSVWIDLTDIGLDHKLVLRSNGTAVYMTQDIALAYQKEQEFSFDRSIYVVGNEQDYHFKVLFEILKRLGVKAAENLYHLSYGMVELPTGKMKSREGTVVDADDLILEVAEAAKEISEAQGKLSGLTEDEKSTLYQHIGLGALRYFILRVDPRKRMVFDPRETIDFNGDAGPFLQYTHARTCSLLRNAEKSGIAGWHQQSTWGGYAPVEKEILLVRHLATLPEVRAEAAQQYSPALMAHFAYETAVKYSQFYHDCPVLRETDEAARMFRLALTEATRNTLRYALSLLDIHAPDQM
jgi:arginyl-tRNA synthetase